MELDTTVSGAWMLAAPRRENLVPERVPNARYLALIIGVRSEFEGPAGEIRANLSRRNSRVAGSSRDTAGLFAPFATSLFQNIRFLSSSDLSSGRLDDVR